MKTNRRMAITAIAIVAMSGCVPTGSTPTTTTAKPTPKPIGAVRPILFCASDGCSGSVSTVQSRAGIARAWYQRELGTTFSLLKAQRVTSPHSSAYFRYGNSHSEAEVAEITRRILAEPGIKEWTGSTTNPRKLLIIVGFDSITRCGATIPGRNAIVSQQRSDPNCANRQATIYAHELGHGFGLSPTADYHRTDGSLMHTPYACNANKTLDACHLNSGDKAALREDDGTWFATSDTEQRRMLELGADYVTYSAMALADDQVTAPLYQYFNGTATDHFYTIARDDAALAAYGWTYEGCQGQVFVNQEAGTTPLLRYWNAGITDHFYTVDGGDYSYFGYQQEPYSTGFVYHYNSPSEGTVPLYRYWNATGGDHYYGTTRNDAGFAIFGYSFDKIEAYVLPTPDGGCP